MQEENANRINEDRTIPIDATEIIAKYKNIENRINFCYEKNWYHPNEVGFDAKFFMQVLQGTKKYLPCNFANNHKLKYFRKGETLDKEYILSKMGENEEFAKYVPDNCKVRKLSRDFLLRIIAFVDPNLYDTLYATYKEETLRRTYNKWGDYNCEVKESLANDIKNFVACEPNKKSQGGFRLTKNATSTNVFKLKPNARNNLTAAQKQIIKIEEQQQEIARLNELNKQNYRAIEEMQKNMQEQNQNNQNMNQNMHNQVELVQKLQNQVIQQNEMLKKMQAEKQLMQNNLESQKNIANNAFLEIKRREEENNQLKSIINSNKNSNDMDIEEKSDAISEEIATRKYKKREKK